MINAIYKAALYVNCRLVYNKKGKHLVDIQNSISDWIKYRLALFIAKVSTDSAVFIAKLPGLMTQNRHKIFVG